MSIGDVGQPFIPAARPAPVWVRLICLVIAAAFMASPAVVYLYRELFS